MDIIIGSGIGGLLAAAKLASLGREVVVFEKKNIPGGRFTNIAYKGFTLSTGALHMLPHGSKGPTAGILEELGIHVDIIDSVPPATIMFRGRQYSEVEFQKMFTFGQKLRIFWKNFNVKRNTPQISYGEFIEGIGSELLLRYADAFCRFVFSAPARKIPLKEALMATAYTRYYGGPGIIRGGCKSVVDALGDYIQSHGGRIHTGCPVEEILVSGAGKVEGVVVKGGLVCADIVISDIGPKETAGLLGSNPGVAADYGESVDGVVSSLGIKISFCSDTSLISHSGVMFTPDCRRIGGVIEVTAADASLAPAGKHLFMSHQHLDPHQRNKTPGEIKQEIDAGITELESLFPQVTRDDVLLVQTYTGEPVNRALQGCDVGIGTVVGGLYLAGDGVKDGIEVEGIARCVNLLVQRICGDEWRRT